MLFRDQKVLAKLQSREDMLDRVFLEQSMGTDAILSIHERITNAYRRTFSALWSVPANKLYPSDSFTAMSAIENIMTPDWDPLELLMKIEDEFEGDLSHIPNDIADLRNMTLGGWLRQILKHFRPRATADASAG